MTPYTEACVELCRVNLRHALSRVDKEQSTEVYELLLQADGILSQAETLHYEQMDKIDTRELE